MSEQNEQLRHLAAAADGEFGEDSLVTVAIYPEPASANLARTALESAGIPAFLHGENANNLIPIAFSARLQVASADQARALAVLSDADLDPESLESVTAAEMAGETDPRP